MINVKKKKLRIAVSVFLQDAGEATRSLEILKGVRDYAPEGYSLEVVFLSHGGKFEKNVFDQGFQIYQTTPRLEGVGFHNDLQPGKNNFVGDPMLTQELLDGEISALEECRPDLILHGFWPFASLARRMVQPEIPGICFLPLPLEKNLYGAYLMNDVPDQIKPLTYLPVSLRRKIMKSLPVSLKLKAPMLKQQNIINAAYQGGWQGERLDNLFDLLKSDLTIVNDLPEFYKDVPIPSHYKITGPLYSQPADNETVDEAIQGIFDDKQHDTIKLFCTMGSSGKANNLIEAVKAIVSLDPDKFRAVILVPKAVCSIEEIMPYVKTKTNIYLTDQFVPAKLVNALADIVICHGGQGTLQTAVASGTPIIGFAMQPEQQINLDHIVACGAGIRIPITQWHEKNINSALSEILADPSFKRNAQNLAQKMSAENGRKKAATAIWSFIEEHRLLNNNDQSIMSR